MRGRRLIPMAAVLVLAGGGTLLLAQRDTRRTRLAEPVQVVNFPETQGVTGTVNVGNLPGTQQVVTPDGTLRVISDETQRTASLRLIPILSQTQITQAVTLNPGDILVTSANPCCHGGILVVDPTSGKRTTVSSSHVGTGPIWQFPVGVALESDGHILVSDGPVPRLFRVDPTTGNRSIVSSSSVGTGRLWQAGVGIAVESDGRILVNDYLQQTLFRVDPRNGNRTIVGTGPSSFGIALESDGQIQLIAWELNALVRVDPTTGNRSIVSSSSVGTGPKDFRLWGSLAVGSDGQIIVYDSANDVLLAVDPTNGNRAIVSDSRMGWEFHSPYGIAVEADGHIIVGDAYSPFDSIRRVDPVSGNRMHIPSNTLGAGDAFSAIRSIAIVRANGDASGHPKRGRGRTSASDRLSLDAMRENAVVTSLGSDPPPGEVTGLLFTDQQTLEWNPEGSAGVYNLYRDLVSRLSTFGYGSCEQQDLTDSTTTDPDTPPVGDGFFYLVTAENPLSEEGIKGFDSSGYVRPNPDPCQGPRRVLDEENSVSAVITPEGGTLATTGADGTVFTLNIPPDALSMPLAVSLTPLLSITNIPLSNGVLAAAQLDPDGLQLSEPATLTIELTMSMVPPNTAGFLFQENGGGLQLIPIETSGNAATFQLTHFSEEGVIDLDLVLDQITPFLLNKYYGDAGILNILINPGDSCPPTPPTCTQLLGSRNQVFYFARMTDLVPFGNFPPRPCDPEGAFPPTSPDMCSTLCDLGEAARGFLQDATRGAFITANMQCLTDPSQERTALECILLAENIPGGEELAAELNGLKTCGIASIEVLPLGAAPSLFVGQTVQLEAIAKDSSGNILPGRDLGWGSLDPTIATVVEGGVTASGGSQGLVTGQNEGSADIIVFDQLAIEVGVTGTFRRIIITNCIDMTGSWHAVTTSTDNNCEDPVPPPEDIQFTQVGRNLSVTYASFGTLSGEVQNFDEIRVTPNDPLYTVVFPEHTLMDSPDCNLFFADISAFFNCQAPEEECIPLFCQETQAGDGTLSDDGLSLSGRAYRLIEFEYRIIVGGLMSEVTASCEGVDMYTATKQ